MEFVESIDSYDQQLGLGHGTGSRKCHYYGDAERPCEQQFGFAYGAATTAPGLSLHHLEQQRGADGR
jgi:hypothetical protein